MYSKAKPILGFEDYGVTRSGRIWSDKTRWWLKPGSAGGYANVTLMRDGGRYTFNVHRLVLETFVGPCPVGMEAMHLDGNKQKNTLGNLKWGTFAENKADNAARGVGPAKLNEYKVSWIKQLLATGRFTGVQIAKVFGVKPPAISDIKTGKTYGWVA